MTRPPTSKVSVDVLTLRYNPEQRIVEIGVSPRENEPFADQLALPGVVLWEGERLADAAKRAVKTKLGTDLLSHGQLTVFDEPARDPRGFTLSVAMWGVGEDLGDTALWYPLDEIPDLAFDHNRIVEECRPLLVERLWHNIPFTQALTGPAFPVSAAVAITRSLTGTPPDRGNLNRKLASMKGLDVSHKKVVLGRGRPGTLWEWRSPLM
ncbi:NUDIX hydrolase [Nigerium massiliense]|uniref:NUDIX hydrolase n=1 Tax=Nigerium massiliense TaxID=1522317 RepID=UPI00058F8CF2|nr:NUDIX hydrolase [Nigerium massiliense]